MRYFCSYDVILTLFFTINQLAYSQCDDRTKANISLSPIFAINSLNWSIAGNIEGRKPNVLSELKFENIISAGAVSQISYRLFEKVNLSAEGGILKTIGGKGNDIDYTNDNRKNPSYRLNFNSSNGNIIYYSARIISDISEITFIDFGLAYTNYKQRFSLTSSKIPDLDSHYRYLVAKYGVLLNKTIPLIKSISLENNIVFQRAKYKGKGNWNLIKEFQHPLSFEHISTGFAVGYHGTILAPINKNLFVKAIFSSEFEKIGKGLDIAYLEISKEQYTQYNGSEKKMFCTSVGLAFYFDN